MVIRQKLIQTKGFKELVKATFETLDGNKDGQIDREELMMGICHLHYKLAAKFPGISSKPTKESVTEVMNQCDLDASGGLSLQEFEVFATKWFESQSIMFGSRLVMSSAMTMVVVPGAASIVREVVPLLKFIPRPIFKLVFGVAYKLSVIALKKSDE